MSSADRFLEMEQRRNNFAVPASTPAPAVGAGALGALSSAGSTIGSGGSKSDAAINGASAGLAATGPVGMAIAAGLQITSGLLKAAAEKRRRKGEMLAKNEHMKGQAFQTAASGQSGALRSIMGGL
jgi:hypothetical protein